jgi:spore coat protein U-like protein
MSTPVLVEYNLFTQIARHVVYGSKAQTIAASGDVSLAA